MGDAIGDDFRRQAEIQRKAARVLVEANDFDLNPKKQVTATVGFVSASILEALGSLVDYLRSAESYDLITERRRQVLERNDAIRTAAARGDWTEFDRLVSEGGTARSPGA